MLGDARLVEVSDSHRHIGEPGDGSGYGLPQRSLAQGIRKFGDQPARPVGCRHHAAADLLRQRLNQRGHQFLAKPRHLPVETRGREPGEHRDRHLNGHPVVFGTRLEQVVQRQPVVVLHPVGGVQVFHRFGRRLLLILIDEVLGGHGQQFGGFGAGGPPPGFEQPLAGYFGRYAPVVELEHRLVIEEDVASAGAFLQPGQLGAQRPVGNVEGLHPVVEPVNVPVPVDESIANKQLARVGGVNF